MSDKKQDNPRMDWESKDLNAAFRRFREHAEFMFKGPLSGKTEEVRCNYLMLWVGDKGRHIYSTWKLDAGDEKKLKTYYDKFGEYCKPKSNKIYNRYLFGSRVQEENETFEQFVTELKTLMKDCEYLAEIQDELIRDHIVFGVRSSKIREKMILEGSDLTLDKCMDIAHTYELSVPQSQAIGNQTTPGAAVDSLSYQNRGRGRGKRRNTRQSRDQYTRQSRDQFTRQSRDQNMRRSWDQNMRQSRDQMQNCQYCGNKLHKHKTECPAYGKQCHKCSKYNHFAKFC